MNQSVRRLLALVALCLTIHFAGAQPSGKESKPYKVMSSGRQLTIRSSKPIRNLMVWTIDGHRVVEQKGMNETQVKLEIPVQRNACYLMIEMAGGKMYTERIGLY